MKYYVGIDVGGTSVKMGLFNDKDELLERISFNTRTVEYIVDDIYENINKLFASKNLLLDDLKGIGIGFPGHVDGSTGTVVYSNNLVAHNFEIVKLLKQKIDTFIRISNDANVAALGEYHFGRGKEFKNIVFVTLGTGIGGGIIIDGHMLEGKNGAGAEIGHMVISTNGQLCSCGRRGCFETYASATALIRNARVAMINNPTSLLWKYAKKPEDLDGMGFFDALAENDKVATIVFEQYIEDLADGLTNLANIFRPDAIILGGGISYRGDSLMEPLQNRLAKMIYGGQWNARVELMVSTLKNDAGIYGAYAMCTKLK
ncbi:MAG: ROK family protein [Bacilli bacterium]|nr:ROK family protein [Bacilli bacterium]